ncbi:hypothetical protein MVEN_02230100 [Mycena venus]|uniref:Uncharacterized protein n=1 Tax=Mycena venus TaxID=2733690 RepID=A0A8H6X7P4_9AGAR|nr:hypothetical protein MVEN_02230100 [Mycena venus]
MPPVLEPSDRAMSVSAGESSRLRRRPAVVLRAPTNGPVVIYCGAEDPITSENISEYDYDEHRPWTVQILPEAHLPPPPRKKARSSRSNGCGTQVHSSVCMMRRNQCWYGSKEELAPSVVPLEKSYFPPELAQVLDLKDDEPATCGCVLSGIGCAVCGNPLGAVQTYCATHSPRGGSTAGPSGYVFATSAVSPGQASTSQNSSLTETPIIASPPTWNTQIPRNGAVPLNPRNPSQRARHALPTHTHDTRHPLPFLPPGYISFIPPTAASTRTTTSFVPPTTTSFVPPTTTPAFPHPQPQPQPSSPHLEAHAHAHGPLLRNTITFDQLMAGAAEAAGATPPRPPSELPPRPRRRRTLRTPESVERYFGGDPTVIIGAAPGAGANDTPSVAVGGTSMFTSASPGTSPTSAEFDGAGAGAYDGAGPGPAARPSSFQADLQRNVMQIFGSGAGSTEALPVWGYGSSSSGGGSGEGAGIAVGVGAGAGGGMGRRSLPASPTAASRPTRDGQWYPWDDAVRWVAAQGQGRNDNDNARGGRSGAGGGAGTTTATQNENGNGGVGVGMGLRTVSADEMPASPSAPAHAATDEAVTPEILRQAQQAEALLRARGLFPNGISLQALADILPDFNRIDSSASTSSAPGAIDTTTRVREIERHLGVLGVRAAALDAAAANVRQHIEALRTNAAVGAGAAAQDTRAAPAPSTDVQEAAVAAATRAGLLREARANLRAEFVRRAAVETNNTTGTSMAVSSPSILPLPSLAREAQARDARTEILVNARAAIAEERARLSEMQERLAALGERTLPTPSVPTSVPAASSSSSSPAAASSPALVADIRSIVRDQTALLSRVSGLIADMGARVGALEGVARAGGSAATTLARARETLERADRTLRRASSVTDEMSSASPWRASPERVVDMDTLRAMEAETQRLVADAQRAAAALAPSPSGDVPQSGAAAPPADEEDKRPRRRTFFER